MARHKNIPSPRNRGRLPGEGSSPDAQQARRKGKRWSVDLDRVERRIGLNRLRGGTVEVIRRVVTGVWNDGFIHAGNLAYMTMLSLFPFFIVMSAVFSMIGEQHERAASVHAFMSALPRVVRQVLEPVAGDVIQARQGWLLWAGGAIALWTVSSLIETIRDILRRAYGTETTQPFWRYRLLGGGLVMVAVISLLVSLYVQLAIDASRSAMTERLNPLAQQGLALIQMPLARLLPAAILFGAMYLLFFMLAPGRYRRRAYPKWPGAALVTLWWGMVSSVLPLLLRVLLKYDLTYGSLAGVMISLFFFWLVGLGIVTGAELNAALARPPEERDAIGQSDDRARRGQ